MFNTLAPNRYPEPWVVLREQNLVPCPRCQVEVSPVIPAIPATVPEPVSWHWQPHSAARALIWPSALGTPLESTVPQALPTAGTGSALNFLLNLNSQQSSHVGTLQQAAKARGSVCLAHWEAFVWGKTPAVTVGKGTQSCSQLSASGGSEIVVLNIHWSNLKA